MVLLLVRPRNDTMSVAGAEVVRRQPVTALGWCVLEVQITVSLQMTGVVAEDQCVFVIAILKKGD